MRRRYLLIATVLCLVLFRSSVAAAQSSYLYTIGNPTWGMQIPVENGYIVVNNGEVHLELSLATHPQRGSLTLDEALVYDSRIWQIVPSGSSYSWQPINVPNSQSGWRFVSGVEAGSVQQWGSSTTSQCPNNGSQWFTYTTYAFTWADPSGTSHYFNPGTGEVTQNSCTWNNGEPSQPTGTAYSWDTSGYYMSVANYTTATVYDANGDQVYPNPMDTNGNSFTTDGNGNLVDTIGRTPVKVSTNGNQTYYDVLTIGGATKRYTVTTETINVTTSFNQSAVNEYSGGLTAIQSISLPDGSSYQFNYDSGTSSGHYGEMTSMVLPTGGTVSFGWLNYKDSYQNFNRWLASYSGGDGSYTFTPQVVTLCSGPNDTGCQEKMTVTDGNQNYVTYLLTLNNGAWNSQLDYYKSGGTHLVTTVTNYNFSSGTNYIQAQSSTTTLDDTGQPAQAIYTYNSPVVNKLSKLQEWDYYTGSPSQTPTRERDYTYNYTINGASLLTQTTLKNSSGSTVAQTTYNYDNNANITSVVSGVNGTSVTTATHYDSYGMPTSTTDGNNNTTTYSNQCSDAYPSTVTYPTINGQNLQRQTNYDCSTGLVTSSKDPNGVVNNFATTYNYFTSGNNIGRLQSVSYPDGGSTTYSYPSAVETDLSVAQTSSVSTTTKSILDSFGRPYQTEVSAPEGTISSETSYDATGRPACVWTPHLQGTISSTDGSTCTSYDVLGRTTQATMPDNNSLSWSYSGNVQTVTDELSHSRQYTYDAFQRLTSVLEPNSSGTLSYETDYQYDALNNLVQVDQWGGARGSSGDRQRLFAYDNLGRKVAESVPEEQSAANPASLSCSGASGSNWTTCYSYDNNGNVISTSDNAHNTVSYSYDALNRVTWEHFPGGSYGYGYDGDGESGNPVGAPVTNTLGRLTHASNEVNAAGTFWYDTMGRLTQEWLCIPQDCTYDVRSSATYDLAGNMISFTYPDGRVVSQTFDMFNRLTGVQYAKWGSTNIGSSYYSGSAFLPPGQTATTTMGNGVTIQAGFNNRQSITSLAYSNSGGTLWSRQYTWDKNASNLLLAADGVSGYARSNTYDPLNRLISAADVNPNSTQSTATVTINGSEQSTTIYVTCGPYGQTCPQTIWDSGPITLTINGTVYNGGNGYGQGSTASGIASTIASEINAGSLATASVSGSTIYLTSIGTGPSANYSLSGASSTGNPSYFSGPSFTVSAPSSMTGGSYGGNPQPGGLNESYSYDSFGNLTSSGSYNFSPSYSGLNQLNGYSYDADGNQTSDIYGHSLAFDANGMLTSVNGGAETYTYDAQGNRVQVAGSATTDYVYFGGVPIATVSAGSWTDLIYAGGDLLAEVAGGQSATPTYRLMDNLGTLGGSLSGSGSLGNTVNYTPYGELFSGSTSDSFGFTGLPWDSTTALWHADARQFSPQQSRWQSPDLYEGSYNWGDPQSLNRYAYVNGRPMWSVDPTGQDGGSSGGFFCIAAVGSGGTNIAADAGCATFAAFDAFLAGLFFHPHFHGSLRPRPSATPWDDKFGVPYGGLTNGINQAIGLPTGSQCEFGACGGGPMNATPGQGSSGVASQTWQKAVAYAKLGWMLGNAIARFDPTHGPVWQQKQQSCINQINSKPDGWFYNEFSYLSPVLGPDAGWGAAIHDTASEVSQRGALGFLKAGAKNWRRTGLGSGSGFAADVWEAADSTVLVPLAAGATVGQVTVHAGCGIAAQF